MGIDRHDLCHINCVATYIPNIVKDINLFTQAFFSVLENLIMFPIRTKHHYNQNDLLFVYLLGPSITFGTHNVIIGFVLLVKNKV